MPPPMFRSPWGPLRGINFKREHPVVRIDRKYCLKDENSEPKATSLKTPLNALGEPMVKVDVAAAAKKGMKKENAVKSEAIKAKAKEVKEEGPKVVDMVSNLATAKK